MNNAACTCTCHSIFIPFLKKGHSQKTDFVKATYSFVRSRSRVILNVAVDLFRIVVSVEEVDRDVLLKSVHVMSPDAM